MRRFDAIVLGGGPAGAVVAGLLAGRGWRTGLIESREVGGRKPCGDCLHPEGVRILRRLGLESALDAAERGRIRRLCLVGENFARRGPIEIPLPWRETGVIVDRVCFDQTLRQHAADRGVEVRQPARGRIVRGGDDGATVVLSQKSDDLETWTAPLIIGADGLRSTVAAGDGWSGSQFGFAATLPRRLGNRPPDAITMCLLPEGYVGCVDDGRGKVHVAGLLRRRAAGPPPSRLLTRIAASSDVSFDATEGVRCAGIGPLPWRARRLTGPTTALVGDAAATIEPFTGEGMTMALRGAVILAETLASKPPGTWNEGTARGYARRWREVVGRHLRRGGLIGLIATHVGRRGWVIRRGPTTRFARVIVRRLARGAMT